MTDTAPQVRCARCDRPAHGTVRVIVDGTLVINAECHGETERILLDALFIEPDELEAVWTGKVEVEAFGGGGR